VSGGVKRAVDGSLAIMVGGPEPIATRCQSLFEAMGKTIKHVGGPGAGHAVKALNNYVSAAGLVAAAEALIVGQAFGLDPAVMTDVFNSSTGRNNSTENKLKQFILSGRFGNWAGTWSRSGTTRRARCRRKRTTPRSFGTLKAARNSKPAYNKRAYEARSRSPFRVSRQ
jgi:6-phosphogluconate dehydrogenase (decarboxylating)